MLKGCLCIRIWHTKDQVYRHGKLRAKKGLQEVYGDGCGGVHCTLTGSTIPWLDLPSPWPSLHPIAWTHTHTHTRNGTWWSEHTHYVFNCIYTAISWRRMVCIYLQHLVSKVIFFQPFNSWLFIPNRREFLGPWCSYMNHKWTHVENLALSISLSSLFFQPGTTAGVPYFSRRSLARSLYTICTWERKGIYST